MNYLETLVQQWLDYREYFVRCNVNIGRLPRGGWAGEIDIAAYHPKTKHFLHVECSGDAVSWPDREKRFEAKFSRGQQFIAKEIFPWLECQKGIEQWALVWNADQTRKFVGGGKVVTCRTLYLNIARDIRELQKDHNRILPEKYALLRAMQETMRHVGDDKQLPTDRLLPDPEQPV